jgi:hypothetical protein
MCGNLLFQLLDHIKQVPMCDLATLPNPALSTLYADRRQRGSTYRKSLASYDPATKI